MDLRRAVNTDGLTGHKECLSGQEPSMWAGANRDLHYHGWGLEEFSPLGYAWERGKSFVLNCRREEVLVASLNV